MPKPKQKNRLHVSLRSVSTRSLRKLRKASGSSGSDRTKSRSKDIASATGTASLSYDESSFDQTDDISSYSSVLSAGSAPAGGAGAYTIYQSFASMDSCDASVVSCDPSLSAQSASSEYNKIIALNAIERESGMLVYADQAPALRPPALVETRKCSKSKKKSSAMSDAASTCSARSARSVSSARSASSVRSSVSLIGAEDCASVNSGRSIVRTVSGDDCGASLASVSEENSFAEGDSDGEDCEETSVRSGRSARSERSTRSDRSVKSCSINWQAIEEGDRSEEEEETVASQQSNRGQLATPQSIFRRQNDEDEAPTTPTLLKRSDSDETDAQSTGGDSVRKGLLHPSSSGGDSGLHSVPWSSGASVADSSVSSMSSDGHGSRHSGRRRHNNHPPQVSSIIAPRKLRYSTSTPDLRKVGPSPMSMQPTPQESLYSPIRKIPSMDNFGEKKSVKFQDEQTNSKTRSPRSVTALPEEVAANAGAKDLRIFVLLLAPKTRRFELIPIECNPATTIKAVYANLVPSRATERSLKRQKYVGLCRALAQSKPTVAGEKKEGPELRSNSTLADYEVKTNDLFIAVPQVSDGVAAGDTGSMGAARRRSVAWNAEQCVKMGNIILGNPRVMRLVKYAAQNTTGQPQKAAGTDTEEKPTTSEAVNRNTKQVEKAAKPMPPQIKETEVNEEIFISQRAVVSNSKSLIKSGKRSTVVTSRDNNVVVTYVAFLVKIALLGTAVAAVVVVAVYHTRVTSPLSPGDIMRPGEWRSNCGLPGMVFSEEVTHCHPVVVEVTKEGSIACYDGTIRTSRNLLWEMKPHRRNHREISEDKFSHGAQTSGVRFIEEHGSLESTTELAVPSTKLTLDSGEQKSRFKRFVTGMLEPLVLSEHYGGGVHKEMSSREVAVTVPQAVTRSKSLLAGETGIDNVTIDADGKVLIGGSEASVSYFKKGTAGQSQVDLSVWPFSVVPPQLKRNAEVTLN